MARLAHTLPQGRDHALVPVRTQDHHEVRAQREQAAVLPSVRRRLPRVVRLHADRGAHRSSDLHSLAIQNYFR